VGEGGEGPSFFGKIVKTVGRYGGITC
jgi:hypothetical protein